MKDYTKEQMEAAQPEVDALIGISYCLGALHRDEEHSITDEVVEGLMFQDVIGILLRAHDEIKEARTRKPNPDPNKIKIGSG